MRWKAVLSQTGDRRAKGLLLPEMANEPYPEDGGFRPRQREVQRISDVRAGGKGG